MQNGEIKGTRYPTGHNVLIDARFEIPYGRLCICYVSNLRNV